MAACSRGLTYIAYRRAGERGRVTACVTVRGMSLPSLRCLKGIVLLAKCQNRLSLQALLRRATAARAMAGAGLCAAFGLILLWQGRRFGWLAELP